MRDIICARNATEYVLSKATLLLEFVLFIKDVVLYAIVSSTIAGPIK